MQSTRKVAWNDTGADRSPVGSSYSPNFLSDKLPEKGGAIAIRGNLNHIMMPLSTRGGEQERENSPHPPPTHLESSLSCSSPQHSK